MRRTFVSRELFLVIGLLLPALPAVSTAQEALRLVDGHWYDGDGFVRRELYAVDGVLRDRFDGAATVVDLQGGWVVPGFGDAHTHGVGGDDFQAENQRFLQHGVFYVANPNGISSRMAAARRVFEAADTVDARFASGSMTCSGGHPIQIFERGPQASEMAGDAYWVIDDLTMLEAKWPAMLEAEPDFLKVILEFSELHTARKTDPAFYGKRGLDPSLVAPIVERAHAAGLRVAAHVTSRQDFRTAVAAGVDEIAHLPLEPLTAEDATMAAAAGTVVVTTVLSHRPAAHVADLDALHRSNLRRLQEAQVPLVLGTDSQASVVDEVLKLESLAVMERGELLRMLVSSTPKWVFPDRRFDLADGGEASFVVLEANPLDDLGALRKVDARYKSGHRIEMKEPDQLPGIGQQLVHTLMSQGTEAAIAEYHRLRTEQPEAWDFSEGQLNALGYAMIQHGKAKEAIVIFQLNCEQYPTSSNVWDSLGDAHAEAGDPARAIEAYEKALAIDPQNEGSRQKLENLKGG